MPLWITNRSGDGINDTLIATNIQLPDSGSSVTLSGIVMVPTVTPQPVAITGSPLTAPTVPVSGSTFWNIQVDAITGAATVQTSTAADPAPQTSSDGLTPKVVIFRQTLTAGSSSATLSADTSATPDQPI